MLFWIIKKGWYFVMNVQRGCKTLKEITELRLPQAQRFSPGLQTPKAQIREGTAPNSEHKAYSPLPSLVCNTKTCHKYPPGSPESSPVRRN